MNSHSVVEDCVRSVVAGGGFGAALTLSKVYLPRVIMEQMRMRDFHMLEVFLSATGLSAIVFVVLERLGLASRVTRSNSQLGVWKNAYGGNIVGGGLIGVGMAVAGACPGTVVVQFAQGIESARWTVLGAVLGGVAWVLVGRDVIASPAAGGASATTSTTKAGRSEKSKSTTRKEEGKIDGLRRLTIPQALGIDATATMASFIALTFGIVALSSRYLPGKSEAILPTFLCGALVASAQAASLIIAGQALGTSAAYEQLGRYILAPFRQVFTRLQVSIGDLPIPPRSVLFALGMALGSIGANSFQSQILNWIHGLPLLRSGLGGFVTETLKAGGQEASAAIEIPVSSAVVGGFVLSFGARMAGGCTSGHGISGLSSLSWASLISVIAMFGGGIVARIGLDAVGL